MKEKGLLHYTVSLMGQLIKSVSLLAAYRLREFLVEVLRGGNTRKCASVAGQLGKG